MENSGFVIRNVSELKPHPKNDYFFDAIEGDKWVEFVESVKLHGVINPIVIAPDGTIISGHMRVEACKALGIQQIKCYVLNASEEDQEVALIESNIRQRGVVNSPDVKLGRVIKALEKYKSKEEVRNKLQIDSQVASRSRRLASMPEEMQELVELDVISPRTALTIVQKLTPEQQVELAKQLDPVAKYTQKEIAAAIEEQFPNREEIAELQVRLADAQKAQNEDELALREKVNELTQRERKAYEDLQAEKKSKKNLITEYERRIESIESLLESASENAVDMAELVEERDEYQQSAESAQRDADLMLVCSLIETVTKGLTEVSNDPTPLYGMLADRAAEGIGQLKQTLDKITHRLEAMTGAA